MGAPYNSCRVCRSSSEHVMMNALCWQQADSTSNTRCNSCCACALSAGYTARLIRNSTLCASYTNGLPPRYALAASYVYGCEMMTASAAWMDCESTCERGRQIVVVQHHRIFHRYGYGALGL